MDAANTDGLNMSQHVGSSHTHMPFCLYCAVTECLTCSLSASVSTSPSPTPELLSFSQDGSTYIHEGTEG